MREVDISDYEVCVIADAEGTCSTAGVKRLRADRGPTVAELLRWDEVTRQVEVDRRHRPPMLRVPVTFARYAVVGGGVFCVEWWGGDATFVTQEVELPLVTDTARTPLALPPDALDEDVTALTRFALRDDQQRKVWVFVSHEANELSLFKSWLFPTQPKLNDMAKACGVPVSDDWPPGRDEPSLIGLVLAHVVSESSINPEERERFNDLMMDALGEAMPEALPAYVEAYGGGDGR